MHVEIWSDIACPWCYVGKRRFETALADFDGRDEVRVDWRSFELDPTAPVERPHDAAAHIASKYGMSREHAMARHAEMSETAARDGIDFRFDLVRTGNTFDGHRILQLAKAHGLQTETKERLMRANFSEGAVIGDHDTLARLAREAGLPEDEVGETLASDRYANDVRHDEEEARRLGISAVPFFVVNREVAVSGAQPVELFAALLERGRQPVA